MKLLNAYLWGYSNWEAADHSFRKFREFYPDGTIHIQVDNGGDMDNYNKIAQKWGATIQENEFRVGRCGVFGDYAQTSNGPENSRDCWPKESCIKWCENIYQSCLNSDSKFLIVLEEDSFILKPISILNQEFGISVFECNTNTIPDVLMNMVEQLGGNTNIPVGKWGKGYGAGGGFIVDCKKWISSWEYFKPILQLNYEILANQNKLIGWSDCIAQLVIMVGGYEVLANPNYVQTWFDKSDLYPNCTNWRDAEIVDYLKDIEEIKKI